MNYRRGELPVRPFTFYSLEDMRREKTRIGSLMMIAGTIFGLWMVGGVVLTAFELWRLDAFGRYEVDFSDVMIFGLLRGAIWALVTPLVIWVAYRFPVQKPRRVRKIVLLIPVVLILALFREAFGVTLSQLTIGTDWSPREILDAWSLRLDVNTVIIAGIMVGANLVRQQRESVERQRRSLELQSALMRAELNQLRADLQPHFLFNALNGIASLVHSDPDRAERMLVAMSRLLRRTLEVRDASRIRLAEELELVRDYLELSRMRFGEKLTFRIEAGEGVLGLGVPPLLLQPLVENAVRHGRLANGDDATIEIVAFSEQESLRVQVRDDGPGCDSGEALARAGVGLSNARGRLELLYGGAASMVLHRQQDQFVVDLSIPL
jgi:two-component system, LytTR family, sensor kinase